MDKYSHRERLELILAGETPDRYAASFWRHFLHREHCADGTIEAMVSYQKHFDWDFMKINPRASYHAEGWGLRLRWSHAEFTKHTKVLFPIKTADDWTKIEPLDLATPALAEHLKVVSEIRKSVGKDLPILMTVFTPLAVAGRMVPDTATLARYLNEDPEKVEPALRAITDTFTRFATELRNAGADGIFFATLQWASGTILTWEQYERFGVPYDLEVIRATQDGAINLLHVCSSENFLERLLKFDYHCQMYNWCSDDPTNVPIDKAYDLLEHKTIVGGVDERGWLLNGDHKEVSSQFRKIRSANSPSRLIIGPGCVVEPQTPIKNLEVIRNMLYSTRDANSW